MALVYWWLSPKLAMNIHLWDIIFAIIPVTPQTSLGPTSSHRSEVNPKYDIIIVRGGTTSLVVVRQ